MTDLFSGSRYLLKGLKLIIRPGLRRFIIVPVAINAIIFSLVILYSISVFAEYMDWMLSFLPSWLDWFQWVLWPIFASSVLMVTFYTFSLVANIIAAPFNGLLSESVEKHLTGEAVENPTGWKELFTNAIPDILNELKKFAYFTLWALPFLVLFIVPVINVAAPFLWIVFSAWMLAVEYADYPSSNHRQAFSDLKKQLRTRKFNSLGFGGATLLLTMIPVINFIAMPAAVAGATALWIDNFQK